MPDLEMPTGITPLENYDLKLLDQVSSISSILTNLATPNVSNIENTSISNINNISNIDSTVPNFSLASVPKESELFNPEPEMINVHPSKEDVAKKGDLGSILIANILEDLDFGQDEKKDGLLSGLMGAFGGTGIGAVATSMFGTIMKAAPLAAIAGGIIWSVMDGITAVGEAENWGVSNVSAFLGGFFGGTGSGWENVLPNAGKGALAGAGVGLMAFGPVGAIAGLLIGGVVSGVLGYFGGEKIAQVFDSVIDSLPGIWEKLKEVTSSIFDFFFEGIKNFFTNIKNKGEGITQIGSEEYYQKLLTDGITGTGVTPEAVAKAQADQVFVDVPGFGQLNASGLVPQNQQHLFNRMDDGYILKDGTVTQLNVNDNIIATQNKPVVLEDASVPSNMIEDDQSAVVLAIQSLKDQLTQVVRQAPKPVIQTNNIRNMSRLDLSSIPF